MARERPLGRSTGLLPLRLLERPAASGQSPSSWPVPLPRLPRPVHGFTGSVMERSHISLPKWVLAIRLMTTSKKGISAHQLHRMLNIGYKSAWFMCHRIREAMTDKNPTPLGGEGKIIEADEAYHGKRETPAQLSRGRIRKPIKSGKSGGAESVLSSRWSSAVARPDRFT